MAAAGEGGRAVTPPSGGGFGEEHSTDDTVVYGAGVTNAEQNRYVGQPHDGPSTVGVVNGGRPDEIRLTLSSIFSVAEITFFFIRLPYPPMADMCMAHMARMSAEKGMKP